MVARHIHCPDHHQSNQCNPMHVNHKILWPGTVCGGCLSSILHGIVVSKITLPIIVYIVVIYNPMGILFCIQCIWIVTCEVSELMACEASLLISAYTTGSYLGFTGGWAFIK